MVLSVIFLIFLCAGLCYFIHGNSASRVVVVVVVVSTYHDIVKVCSSRRNGGERRKKASKKIKEKKETVLLMILQQQQQLVSLFMSADCGLLADWLAGWMLAGCWLLLQLSKIVDASPHLSPSAPCEGDKRLSLVKPFPCCIHVLFSALLCSVLFFPFRNNFCFFCLWPVSSFVFVCVCDDSVICSDSLRVRLFL